MGNWAVESDELLGVGGDTINELVRRRTEEGIELLEEINEDFGELAEGAQCVGHQARE